MRDIIDFPLEVHAFFVVFSSVIMSIELQSIVWHKLTSSIYG